MLERSLRFGREIRELQKERIKLAKQTQGHDRAYFDPIEDDPLYQGFLQAAESDTNEALRSADRSIAFLHRFWETKQSILVRKYGIIWFSPEDMNPSILFDSF